MTDAAGDPEPLSGWRLVVATLGLALTNFIVVLDLTVTNVSVPHIAGSLAVSPSQGTWTITSYAVAEAITVPLTGWLVARFGSVRCLTTGLIGFGLFSFLCGISRTIEMLIVARIFQGVCGGPLMALSQMLMMRIYPKDKLGVAMGAWTIGIIGAPLIGPVAGGYISDNMSWPWIFFINLPVVALCLMIVLRLVGRFETATSRTRIDVVGLMLLITWVGCLQLVLDLGREYDWFGSTLVVMLALTSFVAFCIFVVWEAFDEHPVVDVRLFRNRSLAITMLVTGFMFTAFFTLVVIMPLWLQQTVGYSATDAGLVLAASGVTAMMVTPIIARLIGRVDLRFVVSLSCFWMAFTVIIRLSWNMEADFWTFVFPVLLQGAATPLFAIGLSTLSMSTVPPEQAASAAGFMNFIRSMAAALATAVATSHWDTAGRQAQSDMVSTARDVPGAMETLEQAGFSTEQARGVLNMIVEGQSSTLGMLSVFALAFVLLVISGLLVWGMKRPRTMAGPMATH